MIVVDSSIWVDHFRSHNEVLSELLVGQDIVQHPFITGELAMGSLRQWQDTVDELRALPQLPVVSDERLYTFVFANHLFGSGLGFVDVHLLAAACGAGDTKIWTRDARMAASAGSMGIMFAL